MKRKRIALARKYVTALRKHLCQPMESLEPALELGGQAVSCGIETLELARIHERALTTLKLPSRHASLKHAEVFFSEAVTPIIESHRAARQSKIDLKRLNQTLKQRTAELAKTNRKLQQDIARRSSAEAALKRSGQHYTRLLNKSLQLEEGLRQLTHRVLAAQEDERKNISRDLHNEIAQTLLGINVRLLSLKQEARIDSKGLKSKISTTQELVRQVVRRISNL